VHNSTDTMRYVPGATELCCEVYCMCALRHISATASEDGAGGYMITEDVVLAMLSEFLNSAVQLCHMRVVI
jgi:hypothetical protein